VVAVEPRVSSKVRGPGYSHDEIPALAVSKLPPLPDQGGDQTAGTGATQRCVETVLGFWGQPAWRIRQAQVEPCLSQATARAAD
jgi:hypothetical protein